MKTVVVRSGPHETTTVLREESLAYQGMRRNGCWARKTTCSVNLAPDGGRLHALLQCQAPRRWPHRRRQRPARDALALALAGCAAT